MLLDNWVGGDYETGLAAFKAYAESLPPQEVSKADIEVEYTKPDLAIERIQDNKLDAFFIPTSKRSTKMKRWWRLLGSSEP